jgi:hypothetical protein
MKNQEPELIPQEPKPKVTTFDLSGDQFLELCADTRWKIRPLSAGLEDGGSRPTRCNPSHHHPRANLTAMTKYREAIQ